MAVMTTGSDPGERRLSRPPSDRFGPSDADAEGSSAGPEAPAGSKARGIAYGTVAALVGAVVTVLLGGVMALSAGLLVVWASAGNAIGLATRIGGGPAFQAPRRTWVAIALALAGVTLGQVGLWWYAGTEGGVLPLLPYLGETFGILVPLEAALAAGFAWWAAR